jgi:ribonuclease HI
MSKYYAVKSGIQPGIYTDWKSCEQQVKGCRGAVCKSFKTFEDAQQFIGGQTLSKIQEQSDVEKALKFVQSIPNKDIICYTDGSAKGNPGESGSGIYIVWPNNSYETSVAKYLGKSTNNIAELTAIKIALETVELMIQTYPQLVETDTELYIFTDSEYSLNAITGKIRVNANVELINSIKLIMRNYKLKINIFWVPAHSGIPGNEKANDLAERSAKTANLIVNFKKCLNIKI